jgi:hypothetical protein
MACVGLVQTIDKQGDAALVRSISSVVFSAVASCKRQDRMAKDRTVFDLFWHSERELTSRISAVKPTAKLFRVVMHEPGFALCQGNGLLGVWSGARR